MQSVLQYIPLFGEHFGLVIPLRGRHGVGGGELGAERGRHGRRGRGVAVEVEESGEADVGLDVLLEVVEGVGGRVPLGR